MMSQLTSAKASNIDGLAWLQEDFTYNKDGNVTDYDVTGSDSSSADPDSRRNRNRQGVVRSSGPRPERSAKGPIRGDQLCRHSRRFGRERSVWASQGGVHWGRARSTGQV